MRRTTIGLLGLTLTAALAAGSGGLAVAGPSSGGTPVTGVGKDGPLTQSGKAEKTTDELSNPLEAQRRELQEKALDLVLTGQREVENINGSDVVRVGTKTASYSPADRRKLAAGQKVQARKVDSYVQLSRESTDKIFVVLAEFGDQRDPAFPDRDTDPTTAGPTTWDGPLHNAIPEPDRAKDNSTIWQADYSAAHYRELYFGEGAKTESLKTFYEKQSSGRYSVEGEVTDWVKVKYNEARYGRSDDNPKDANGDDPAVCASNVCPNTWDLLRDALDQWVVDQKAKGRTAAQIKADVTAFDQQDRYDFDGDGNFNEPDGYIDHFQIVHSGGDQADGDPIQGEDGIWSHRWRAYQGGEEGNGPANFPIGGTEIGDTGIWVADYTIQPENGSLSVFAHEYGHDLGLPDHYDTATSGDNPVSWWTLMAQSRVKAKNDVGIGTRAADLGVWDKLQLGWLDYETAVAGQKKTFQLGPHEYNSKKAQALAVVLPKKEVVTALPTPATGTQQWWSGTGDDITSTLTRSATLAAGTSTLSLKAAYDIEADYDYAFVEVNSGSGWTALPSSITDPAAGNGIAGATTGYVPASFDLSAYAGQTVQLRLRYTTDTAQQGNPGNPAADGLFVDDVTLTSGGTAVFTDGAETGTGGWTAAGFTAVGATSTTLYPQYYLASNRTYQSYDQYLEHGPYNFGFGASAPDRAEFFPYQTGLLVNYWDTSYSDNNTSAHPGNGLVLPIDAHPTPIYNLTGQPWRGRIQTYDAPFSLERADSFTLHVDGQANYIRGAKAQPLFDDTRSYWDATLPRVGVKTPGTGVTLKVTKQKGTSMTVKLGTSKKVSAAATLASARGH
ncbi:immune inhibitor A [Friedmanniella luteola]|uniref:Immune inhibitor A n=1 Tax=Friedmanniella luteola TaxID=546871 RepID=A0A1H1YUA4_9ACTN|nr:immune inhibitor A domain-containing protein [Friedmanniella luteola]SDT24869.1 immune inhibitor A [Friedmanniella luteola]